MCAVRVGGPWKVTSNSDIDLLVVGADEEDASNPNWLDQLEVLETLVTSWSGRAESSRGANDALSRYTQNEAGQPLSAVRLEALLRAIGTVTVHNASIIGKVGCLPHPHPESPFDVLA